ncbi:MAG: hypothetical protein WBP81_23140 [Solirubrobacteraceae bacterium]
MPDPELVEQAKRRKFTAKYKLEILDKADARTAPGEIGELLRREGLYTSHLTLWRKQRRDGALKELGRPRGRKPGDRRDQHDDNPDAAPAAAVLVALPPGQHGLPVEALDAKVVVSRRVLTAAG